LLIEHTAKENDTMADSRPLGSIGELGKRRGFKGAPLFTPETIKKQSTSFLSLSSAFSPKTPLSPRPSLSTPRTARLIPSTPRTPLATVTNLLRTPTAKSPKPLSMPMECPVSDELQQCYDLEDPFSVVGESFYGPEIVGAGVPLSNLERLEVYRTSPPKAAPVRSHRTFFKAVQAASCTKLFRIRETNVYDMMVYNFQPKMRNFGKKKAERSARRLRLSRLAHIFLPSNPTTIACLMFLDEDPRVRLPQQCGRNCEVVPEHLGSRPVPDDFPCTWLSNPLWDSQKIVVNIPPAVTLNATLNAAQIDSSPHRQFTDVTSFIRSA
jgi:hypothetical protein